MRQASSVRTNHNLTASKSLMESVQNSMTTRGVKEKKSSPSGGHAKLDPTVMKDWEIAQQAELDMIPVDELALELGLKADELIPMGRQLAKIDYIKTMKRLQDRPTGWTLPIQDFMIYKGAEFIVPVAGAIKLMPGTASKPAFRNIDVDINTGKVTGLFLSSV